MKNCANDNEATVGALVSYGHEGKHGIVGAYFPIADFKLLKLPRITVGREGLRTTIQDDCCFLVIVVDRKFSKQFLRKLAKSLAKALRTELDIDPIIAAA